MGSINLEVANWTPDIASARVRRTCCGDVPGDFQLVLSGNNATRCAGSDLDGDEARLTGSARALPQIFCQPDGGTKTPPQFCNCLVP
jgi:hypothetical protein